MFLILEELIIRIFLDIHYSFMSANISKYYKENKIYFLRRYTRPKIIKRALKDPDVVIFLKDLHLKYVLITIDKASNYIAVILWKVLYELEIPSTRLPLSGTLKELDKICLA